MTILQAPSPGSRFILIFVLIFIIGILIGIWILIRQIALWYYRINDRVELQKRTNELLEELIDLQKNKEQNR
jgi:ABC-type uncharacterized transport system permease subunit